MRRYLLLIGLIAATGSTVLASGIDATATYTDSLIGPNDYQYDLTLTNTGTTTIGTFWFSWIPGAGFMPVAPTNVVSPTGWSDILTNGDQSIQWTTGANLLQPGSSMSGFMFDSSMTPAQLQMIFAGPGLGTGDPVATSFVYIAAPLADPGAQIVATPAAVTATPEPGTLMITTLVFGLVLAGQTARSRRRSRANL